MLAVGFISGEICLGFLQSRTLNHDHFCYVSANSSLYFSSLFLAGLTPFYFAGLGGMKLKWDPCTVSQEAWEADYSSTLLFLVKGILSG